MKKLVVILFALMPFFLAAQSLTRIKIDRGLEECTLNNVPVDFGGVPVPGCVVVTDVNGEQAYAAKQIVLDSIFVVEIYTRVSDPTDTLYIDSLDLGGIGRNIYNASDSIQDPIRYVKMDSSRFWNSPGRQELYIGHFGSTPNLDVVANTQKQGFFINNSSDTPEAEESTGLYWSNPAASSDPQEPVRNFVVVNADGAIMLSEVNGGAEFFQLQVDEGFGVGIRGDIGSGTFNYRFAASQPVVADSMVMLWQGPGVTPNFVSIDVIRSGIAGSNTNFAEDNLTADADRNHEFAGFDLRVDDIGDLLFNVNATTTFNNPNFRINAPDIFFEDGLNVNNALDSVLVRDNTTGEIFARLASTLGGANTNFAEDNLTFDADRSHTGAGFDYIMDGIDEWTFSNFGAAFMGVAALNVVSDIISFGAETAANPAVIRLREPNLIGSNYVALSAPATVGTDITFTLPEVDGGNGDVLTTDGSGNLSFSAAGGANTNFAANDLTFTGDRLHDLDGNDLVMDNGLVRIVDTTSLGSMIWYDSITHLIYLDSIIFAHSAGGGKDAPFENTAFGYGALDSMSRSPNIEGRTNSAFGHGAGRSLKSAGVLSQASSNIFVGYNAGEAYTTGSYNTIVGTAAAANNYTTQFYVTAVGWHAGRNASGAESVFIAPESGENSTASGTVAIGFRALKDNVSGTQNTAVGYSAMENQTGGESTALGWRALGTGAGAGAFNSAFGSEAGRNNTTGITNVFFGRYSGQANTIGSHNTFVGTNAGDLNVSGNYNIIIGRSTDASTSSVSNELNIGNILFGQGVSDVRATGLANGEIGVGTDAPNTTFHVVGDATFDGDIFYTQDDVDNTLDSVFVYNPASNEVWLRETSSLGGANTNFAEDDLTLDADHFQDLDGNDLTYFDGTDSIFFGRPLTAGNASVGVKGTFPDIYVQDLSDINAASSMSAGFGSAFQIINGTTGAATLQLSKSTAPASTFTIVVDGLQELQINEGITEILHLGAAGEVYTPSLDFVDNTLDSIIVIDPSNGEFHLREVSSIGGTNTNFANADLTLTGDRAHEGGSFDMEFSDFGLFDISVTTVSISGSSAININSDMFMPNEDEVDNALDSLLARDNVTGEIKLVEASSLGGGGTNIATAVQTATGDYTHDWADNQLEIENMTVFYLEGEYYEMAIDGVGGLVIDNQSNNTEVHLANGNDNVLATTWVTIGRDRTQAGQSRLDFHANASTTRTGRIESTASNLAFTNYGTGTMSFDNGTGSIQFNLSGGQFMTLSSTGTVVSASGAFTHEVTSSAADAYFEVDGFTGNDSYVVFETNDVARWSLGIDDAINSNLRFYNESLASTAWSIALATNTTTVNNDFSFASGADLTTPSNIDLVLDPAGTGNVLVNDILEVQDGFIYANTNNTGDYAALIRLTGEGTIDNYQGFYAQYDASGNQSVIGTHNTNDALTSSDIELILLPRDGTSIDMQVETSIADNLIIGTGGSAGTSSDLVLAMENGTAPTASITDGIQLYSEDEAASAELKVRDEAGNVTTLSPHNFSGIPEGKSEEMAWAFYSEREDKYVNVDMLKMARILEELTGEKLVYIGDIKDK